MRRARDVSNARVPVPLVGSQVPGHRTDRPRQSLGSAFSRLELGRGGVSGCCCGCGFCDVQGVAGDPLPSTARL